MSDWTAGYVADIGYTYGYYTELNPLRVRLAFLTPGSSFPNLVTLVSLVLDRASAPICMRQPPSPAGLAQTSTLLRRGLLKSWRWRPGLVQSSMTKPSQISVPVMIILNLITSDCMGSGAGYRTKTVV